jgi:hypothetical protein
MQPTALATSCTMQTERRFRKAQSMTVYETSGQNVANTTAGSSSRTPSTLCCRAGATCPDLRENSKRLLGYLNERPATAGHNRGIVWTTLKACPSTQDSSPLPQRACLGSACCARWRIIITVVSVEFVEIGSRTGTLPTVCIGIHMGRKRSLICKH